MEDRSTHNPWDDVLDNLVRGVRTTIDVQRRLVQGATNPSETGAAYVRFLRNQLMPYGRTIADLTVDYYKALATAARDYGTAFYDEVMVGGAHEEHEAFETSPEEADRPAMTLAGVIGSPAAATFTLENHDPVAADVSLEPGLCRGPDGEAFTAPIRVEPSVLTIPPGETATVTVAVDLSADQFRPGVAYRVPLHVDGPRPATVDVTIAAEGAAHKAAGAVRDAEYVVECPACIRRFARTTDSVRLRPHKTPAGDDCPEREGRRAAV